MARSILLLGGTRFMGRLLALRLLARGDRLTVFTRGRAEDPFGPRVERLIGDRTTDDFERLLTGRRFDAVVDFVAFEGRDARRAVDVFAGHVGHYLLVSTGQVYLVRDRDHTIAAREEEYDGPLIARPPGEVDAREWDYGVGKRACEDALVEAGDRLPSTRLRIPMVNGARDPYGRMSSYVRRMLAGEELAVARLDRRVRHVDAFEVAATIDALLGDPRAFGRALNQAQDETPTLAELLRMIGRECGVTPRVREGSADSPFSGAWSSFIDPSAVRALGVAHAPLAVTIARAVAPLLAE